MSFLNVGAALAAAASPANAEVISLRSKKEPKENPNRVPLPSHRHAAPSAPWPWVDLEDGMWQDYCSTQHCCLLHSGLDVDREQLENPAPPIPAFCRHDDSCNNCWTGYPQSRFPNWTYGQVLKSKIHRAITSYDKSKPCQLLRVDVDSNGFFTKVEPVVAMFGKENEVWKELINEEVNMISMSYFASEVHDPNGILETARPASESTFH